MSASNRNRPMLPAHNTDALRVLTARLINAGDSDTAAIIQSVLIEARTLGVIDLWEPREVALTYWVLLLTGVNQANEMQLAKDLLAWQAFFAKDSARVLCVQSSEREAFRCCSSLFAVHDCPTLIMSDSPDMHNNVRVEAELLKKLGADSGELQRFLTRLHALIENGRSIADLKDLMALEAFWRGLRIAFKEAKGLVSISLAPS